MSENLFSGNKGSSMMAGLLYAMTNKCDCAGCVGLRDMSDTLIKEATTKKTRVKKKG